MKAGLGTPVPPTLSSHLQNDSCRARAVTVVKLRQRVPGFNYILLEQINAVSQFNIVGLILLYLLKDGNVIV